MNEIRTFAFPALDAGTVCCVRRGLALALCSLLSLIVVTVAGAAERKPAPRTVGLTLDDKRLALSELRGKPVVVNVWSSW